MDCHCDHIHLRSRNAVAAARFYIETLGAREVCRDDAHEMGRVTLNLGNLTLFIEQAPADLRPTALPPHLGMEHIGFAVADIEAAMADLQRLDVPIVSGITDVRPGLRVIFLDGPDGVRIELLQRRVQEMHSSSSAKMMQSS